MRVFKDSWRDPASGKRRDAERWTVEFRDHLGRVRRLAAFKDAQASEEFGRKLERLASLRSVGEGPDPMLSRWIEGLPGAMRERMRKIGLIDERRLAASKPLSSLLSEFRESLLARGNTEKHAEQTEARARRVLESCGFTFWSDLDALAVERFLRGERERAGGIGIATSNYLLGSTRQFSRWMVGTGKASEDPLRVLRPLNARLDRRRERRALDPDDLVRLLRVTVDGPTRFGMTGAERALLYRVGVESGLRARELRSLTSSSFDLRADPPTVLVQAAYSKRRREDVLPLRLDTARVLESLLRTRLPSAALFRMPASERLPDMLRADLDDAGIPYRDDAGKVFDFHALRHQFITNLARAGVAPKVAQALARHSTIVLTMDRYCHLRAEDEVRALDSLPALPDPTEARRSAVRLTGTDGTPALGVHSASYSASEDAGSRALMPLDATEEVVMARPAGLEPATVGLEIRCSIQLSYGRSISMRAPRGIGAGSALVGEMGFEPTTRSTQSSASTS